MMTGKVTDPLKQVTDSVLLSHLSKQGVDFEYVEFTQDYAPFKKGVSSPYMKVYKDRLSDKKFAVFSQLPMVNADGVMVEVGWNFDGTAYTSKVNQFLAEVKDKTITITLINDQPDGRKNGDKLTYTPSLFLDGKEIIPSKSILYAVDPINENYQNNVIEWDYGICKRWLRLIEGRILGTWRFAENPKGEVSIRYNQKGDFKLHLGQYAVSDSEELLKPEQFENYIFGYPFIVSDSLTFSPDAHVESTSVDGRVYHYQLNTLSWAQIVAAAGNGVYDAEVKETVIGMISGKDTNNWDYLFRGIFLFDTSAIPDSASITAGTLSLYGSAHLDERPWTPNINIYSSAPASNTALAAGDFDSIGPLGAEVAFCDTAITYANFSIVGYNDFVLNAAGIAAISKTAVSKFGTRNANYDVAVSSPTWTTIKVSYLSSYFSEQGTGYKPKLVVTYSVAGRAGYIMFQDPAIV